VIVAFDADPAGRRAAVRAYGALRDITGELLTVAFPDGSDPAGYLRDHGAAALAGLLDDQAYPLADLVIDASVAKFDRWLQFTDGKFSALRAVAPLIAGLPAGQVARQVGRVAERLGLTHAEVTAAVTSALPAVLGRSAPGRRA
jgi:DNA primase